MVNPISSPQTARFEASVKAAEHLRGHPEYASAIALGKALATQIDEMTTTGDPEVMNKMNMRVVPNFQRALYTLGLTPEGFAKITNPLSAPPTGKPDDEDETPPKASEDEGPGDELDALMADMDNVVNLGDRRP